MQQRPVEYSGLGGLDNDSMFGQYQQTSTPSIGYDGQGHGRGLTNEYQRMAHLHGNGNEPAEPIYNFEPNNQHYSYPQVPSQYPQVPSPYSYPQPHLPVPYGYGYGPIPPSTFPFGAIAPDSCASVNSVSASPGLTSMMDTTPVEPNDTRIDVATPGSRSDVDKDAGKKRTSDGDQGSEGEDW